MHDSAIRVAAVTGGGWYATAHATPLLYTAAGAGVLLAVLTLAAAFSRQVQYRDAAFETLELILDFLRPRPFSRSRSRSRPRSRSTP